MAAKKKILIDGTTIAKQMDGLSQYILNTVAHFDCHEVDFTLIVRPNECPEDFAERFRRQGIRIEEVAIPPIGPKRDIAFRRFLKTRERQFDAAFIPSNQFPMALRLPAVYTIHDLIYEAYPEQLSRLSRLKRRYLRFVTAVGLRKARVVVAVSNFTAKEILHFHPRADRAKIKVIYEGYEHLKRILPSQEKSVNTERYFFYLGSSRGHKNLYRLMQAYALTAKQHPDIGLIIAGNADFLTQRERDLRKDLENEGLNINFTGRVSDGDMVRLMSNAEAFVFPSLCEGFGIPVLEAFYYDIPVLCSDNTVFPEVAADAALYFDPHSPQAIAQTMCRFIEQSPEERRAMQQRGKARLALFSWKQTADEIYKNLMSGLSD